MQMKIGAKTVLITVIALLAGGVLMLGLFGCGAKTYGVDYDGEKDFYTGAKDRYKAGEEVTLYYYMIATDTDYSFWLDGERINTGYEEDKGFVITFTMPEHDVKLVCESRNSMVYVPEIEPGTLLVDCFRETVATVGGDGYREMTLSYYDEARAKLEVFAKDDPEDEESCVAYLVPYEAVEKCYDVMYDEDIRSWENRDDLSGITGARYVMKFYDEYTGEYVRVTSEKMPPDGMNAFDALASVMSGYVKDEYLIND